MPDLHRKAASSGNGRDTLLLEEAMADNIYHSRCSIRAGNSKQTSGHVVCVEQCSFQSLTRLSVATQCRTRLGFDFQTSSTLYILCIVHEVQSRIRLAFAQESRSIKMPRLVVIWIHRVVSLRMKDSSLSQIRV